MNSAQPSAMAPQDAQTLPQLIRAAAAAYGDDLMVTLKGDTVPDDAISFTGLDETSAQWARGLIARGVGKGTRIGFILGNGPQFAVLLAAISRIGAIAVPISTLIKANELVRVLRQSDIAGLVVQRSLLGHDYVQRLCDALPELGDGASPDLRLARAPYLRWIVSSGADLPPTFHDQQWLTSAATTVTDEMLREIEVEVHPADQALEIYTSGSMAAPKGVRHLHGPVTFRAIYLAQMTESYRGKEFTAALPMFWVGGMGMSLLPALVSGGVVRCTEGTSTSSAHAMGVVLTEEAISVMALAKPWWGLGMSETFGPYSYGDEFRAEGYPLCAPMDHIADRYEVRVADENNQQVGDGEIGEVQIRGYPVTPGLHKIERAASFTPDGFYQTGDLALVKGTRINFVGRAGEMIKTNGSNVSPAEVELEMQLLDGVDSAYVVGLPDEQRGQLVAAAVVPCDGATLDFAAIEAALRRNLSSYKVPRLYHALARSEVPMLPSNKVARREIAALLATKRAQG